ncbi:hypothetical hypothetical protein [Rhizobium mesoamericanum STM3625]|uniref:Uncharacterized protein n=1 Tax=Rhizobium mesoamericanum STM3625 TaxID=1211777 RepID=K0Q2T4_9HYPH|nr:hypothetical hypothetical protein [Rhizobium mesoamericanum STM3625]
MIMWVPRVLGPGLDMRAQWDSRSSHQPKGVGTIGGALGFVAGFANTPAKRFNAQNCPAAVSAGFLYVFIPEQRSWDKRFSARNTERTRSCSDLSSALNLALLSLAGLSFGCCSVSRQ